MLKKKIKKRELEFIIVSALFYFLLHYYISLFRVLIKPRQFLFFESFAPFDKITQGCDCRKTCSQPLCVPAYLQEGCVRKI